MGFFIRKSFGSGPLRFNLSKNGIGISTGIRGLRVSLGPSGAHLSGGRRGIYFRESLATKRANAISADRPENDSRPPKPKNNLPEGALQIITTASGLILASYAYCSRYLPETKDTPAIFKGNAGLLIGIGMAVLGTYFLISHFRYLKNIREYIRMLKEVASNFKLENLPKLAIFRLSHGIKISHIHGTIEDIYMQLAPVVLEKFDEQEAGKILRDISEALGFWEGLKEDIETRLLKQLTWDMFADNKLTEDEETALLHVQKVFQIPEKDMKEELDAITQSKQARHIIANKIPPLDVDIPLQKGETCLAKADGKFMEKKVLRSFTSQGVKHKEEGLVPTMEGEIYITPKRILIIGNGTTSIKHEKVLDVEVDFDEKLITVIKDGRQKPIYISVPEPILMGSLIEHFSSDA